MEYTSKKNIGASMCKKYNEDSIYQKFMDYDDELEDGDFFKGMYPISIASMQRSVEKRCDELEYVGSVMFDKYPDKVRIEKMVKDICAEKEDFDDEMVQVLLINEMLRRRGRIKFSSAPF